jgi:hypothetical protein
MDQSKGSLTPIADAIEQWLFELGGPGRLAAFRQLPPAMQAGAWRGLREQIELEREGKRAA